MTDKHLRLAIVFPAGSGDDRVTEVEHSRFCRVAGAIAALGVEVVSAPYEDEAVDTVRARLLQTDGVLVWVNPIEAGRDRSILNAMLADVAAAGVVVSAHPDVIEKMGTKEVLFRTRHMSWGCDTRHYTSVQTMQSSLPLSLASGPRVLKQMRGQSGDGVWRVDLATPAAVDPMSSVASTMVRVRHAKRGSAEETMPLHQFFSQCAPYFADRGGMIDQVFQPRLPEGMVRCYMVGDRVAGFGEQLVNALYPSPAGASPQDAPKPGPRLYFPPSRADFQPLKDKLEREWVAELCKVVALNRAQLPVLWDADFLYGPKQADGSDSYVLCEINVCSVYPFPDDALGPLAAEAVARMRRARHSP